MADDKQITTPTTQLNPKFEEAKALAERMEKASAELKAQADRLEQLKSETLLSGTAGLNPEKQIDPNVERKNRLMQAWSGSAIAKSIERYG